MQNTENKTWGLNFRHSYFETVLSGGGLQLRGFVGESGFKIPRPKK